MIFIFKYLDILQSQIRELAPGCRIILRMDSKGKGEGFNLSRKSGSFVVEAESPLAAAYALNKISAGILSGHLAEFMGKHYSAFPLRPLWFKDYYLSQFDESKIEKLCRRLIHWGYNAIGLQCRIEENSPANLKMFRSYGLKVILRPVFPDKENTCILDSSFRLKLQDLQFAKAVDYIFWESRFQDQSVRNNPTYRGKLNRDLATEEMRMLESSFKKVSLIYYIPFNDIGLEDWLPEFFDDAAQDTIISFPAVAGKDTHEHLSQNPLWNQLRLSPDISSTRLLPIINGGLVDRGDGLWPVMPLDVLEYLPRCRRHFFAGAMITVRYMPAAYGWLDAALWVTGQSLWNTGVSELLAETWFAAFRPDLNYITFSQLLKQIGKISLELKLLQTWQGGSEDAKKLAESIAIQLKALSNTLQLKQGKQKKGKEPAIADYFFVFEEEAKKILSGNLPSSRHLNLIEGEQKGPGEFFSEAIRRHASPSPEF